ncbi:MAG: hypothetical protein AAF211_34180, partial [Myxococcota bacterium]
MSDPSLDPESLTPGERHLLKAVRRDRRAHCRGERVRASVLRRLLVEGLDDHPPTGVALDGAVIEGLLDLEGCVLDWPVLFFDCQFGSPGDDKAPLVLRDARLRRLGLHGCRVYGGIKGERVQVESSLFLSRAQIDGPLRFRGARVGGSL